MIQIHRLTAAVIALMLAATLVAGVTPAAATHDAESGDWFDTGVQDDGSVATSVLETVAESISQARKGAAKAFSSTPFSDPPPTAEENAQDAIETFNQDNDTIRQWANTHLDGDSSHDVFRVEFADRSDETYNAYVVATYNSSSGEYTSARAVDEAEFQSMDRSVDASISLGWYASENAASELDEWVARFGSQNESMTSRYRADMLTKYAADVEHDLA